ncbi:MAG: GGDEF domain-containing protein [Acidimicrobiales bacterium]
MSTSTVRSADPQKGADERRPRLGVLTLLLAVVLVPTAGLVVLAATTSSATVERRASAQQVLSDVNDLTALVDARAVVSNEEVLTVAVAIANDLGVGIDELDDFDDRDYRAEILAARQALDDDPTLHDIDALDDELAALTALRADLDEGNAAYAEASGVLQSLTSALDETWGDVFAKLRQRAASDDVAGVVFDRLIVLQSTFRALTFGNLQAGLASQIPLGPPDEADQRALLDARSRYQAAISSFEGRLGPRATEVWSARTRDASTNRFEATLTEVAEAVLAGTESSLTDDVEAYGEAFRDGAPWAVGLTDTVQAAAGDLRSEAAGAADRASTDLRAQIGLAVAVTVLALAAALLLARSVILPVRRLERAAQEIRQGRFALAPIDTSGPRELADTAAAFNDMTSTLASVEAQAVALADDPDAAMHREALPGKTGRALQVAINRLRATMRSAEDQRRELERAATHDGLTGLLNRSAALEIIERDLARAHRDGLTVMALFIDLDGLKPINDTYGHATGDDALRLTAEALVATTRGADVVARIGGDEFLVAGMATDDTSEVEALAHRIRAALADQVLVSPDGPLPLRCSIGLALSREEHATAEALIHEADVALYTAKRQGRDRVAWFHPQSVDG